MLLPRTMLLLLPFLASAAAAAVQNKDVNRVSYDGHQLIRAYVDSEDHILAVREGLAEAAGECSLVKDGEAGVGRPTDLLCSRSGSPSLRRRLSRSAPGLRHEVKVKDFGREIFLHQREAEAELDRSSSSPSSGDRPSFRRYLSYEEILARVDRMAAENPDNVEITEAGVTHENRRVVLVRMGKNLLDRKLSNEEDESEGKAVWIDAGIHAREWIAPMSTLFVMERLLDRFRRLNHLDRFDQGDDQDPVTKLDWYILPLLNPDGYEYSRTTDRMWRKNRAPILGRADKTDKHGNPCRGVDLNRNWAGSPGFGVGADMDNPCSDIFSDSPDFPEQPEVSAAKENLMRLRHRVRAALSVHSFGSLWLISWGYTNHSSSDEVEMRRWGEAAIEAMEDVNGREYDVDPAGVAFKPAGGASDDYAKGRAHIPYAATVELPGDDSGFALPPKEILSVSRELWEGVKVTARFAHEAPFGEDKAWMDEPDIVELENKDRMEKMRRKLMRKGEAAKSRKAKARKNKN